MRPDVIPGGVPAAARSAPVEGGVSRDLGSLRLCPRLPVEYFRSGIASGAEVHHDNDRNLTAK